MDIELKKWQDVDFDVIADIFTRADRSYLADGLPMPYTRERVENWYNSCVREKEGCGGLFRIIYADGRPAGDISVERKEGASYACDADIGYLLLDEFKGKGVMTRAVAMICEEAFAQLDILRISARVYSPNAASRRVLEKNGFALEGCIPRSVLKGENIYDMLLFGKLK